MKNISKPLQNDVLMSKMISLSIFLQVRKRFIEKRMEVCIYDVNICVHAFLVFVYFVIFFCGKCTTTNDHIWVNICWKWYEPWWNIGHTNRIMVFNKSQMLFSCFPFFIDGLEFFPLFITFFHGIQFFFEDFCLKNNQKRDGEKDYRL